MLGQVGNPEDRFSGIAAHLCFLSETDCISLWSHYHISRTKASISLACEFLATVLRILSWTFARHLCECRTSVVRIFMCRELVANWLFKKFVRIFSPKYFARLSRDVRASVANQSPRNFGQFTMQNFHDTRTNVVPVLHDGRATVLRKHAKTLPLSGEKIKLSNIRMNVVRHLHECRTTVVQIKMKISYIRGKVARHSHECRATDVRPCDSREIYFANLSHKRLFNETAT